MVEVWGQYLVIPPFSIQLRPAPPPPQQYPAPAPPPSYLGRITSFMYWMRYVWWILAMTAASVIGTTSLNWTWGGR